MRRPQFAQASGALLPGVLLPSEECGLTLLAPQSQLLAGIGEAVEDLLIQAFISQAAVEAFDQAILLRIRRIRKQSGGPFSRRLAEVDVVPGDASIACPLKIAALVNSVPLSLTMQLGLP